MKYERIERSIEETLVFSNYLKWNLSTNEIDLFLDKMSVEQYLNDHIHQKEKAQQFIDFHFKKVKGFEKGQWCWFWDYEDNFYRGHLAKYHDTYEGSYIDHYLNGHKYCISIEELKKRLDDNMFKKC